MRGIEVGREGESEGDRGREGDGGREKRRERVNRLK